MDTDSPTDEQHDGIHRSATTEVVYPEVHTHNAIVDTQYQDPSSHLEVPPSTIVHQSPETYIDPPTTVLSRYRPPEMIESQVRRTQL